MRAAMKTLLSLTATLLAVAPAFADITLVQETLLKGIASRTTMWIKGDKVRTDNGDTTSVIMDTGTGDMTTLMHEQKMKMTVNTKELAAQTKPTPGADKPVNGTKVTATGKTETVDGHACEIYLSENNGMVVKMWMAKDYPGGDKLREQLKVMEKLAAPDAPKPAEIPGIALKTEYEQQGLKFVTKLISLDDKPVDDAKFTIPADYKAP